jgi:3-hydroxyisobutyrate dehydrogenase
MKGRIGWVGLGKMGLPMVRNLLNAGFDVTVYNRTRAKAELLAERGAKIASSPARLAAEVDTVITMVSDDAALEEVLFGVDGVYEGAHAGQTIVDMSTVAPGTSRRAAARFREKDVAYLDAPVSGSVKPATEGTLVILVGGEREVYEKHLPVFDVLGKQSFLFGPNGKGSEAKLVINLMLGLTLQAFSEALVLGEKLGLDREMLLQMVGTTAVSSPIVSLKTENIREDNYAAAFALKHMSKDFGLALEAAHDVEAVLPATAAAHQTFLAAKANGLGEQDIIAILLQLQAMSGLRS